MKAACFALIVFIHLAASTAAAGEFVHRIVARTSQAAPGVPSAAFDQLDAAAISGEGTIVFRSSLQGASPGTGIWAEESEVLRLSGVQGQASSLGFDWSRPSDPNVADGGTFALPWRVDNQGQGFLDAFWVDPGTGPVNLILQGEQSPLAAGVNFGASITGQDDETVLINSNGQVLFTHRLEGFVDSTEDDVLVFLDGQEPVIVAQEGQPTPAGGVYRFAVDQNPFRSPGLAPDGTVVFVALFEVPNGAGGTESRQGVFKFDGQQTTALAFDRGPCPDGRANCTVLGIQQVLINAAGQVVFGAQRVIEGEPGAPTAFYRANQSGFTSQIFVDDPNSSIFIPCCLGIAALLDSGEPVVAGSNGFNSALFRITNGLATVLVETDQRAPGTPDGVVFSGFSQVQANRAGQIVINGRVAGPGVTSSNRLGLWLSSGNDPLELVVRAGESIEVAPGNDKVLLLTIMQPSAGPGGGLPRNLSNEGELVWEATFADGSTAIVESFIGLPPAPPPTVLAIEPIQSVQDWNNSAPLIEDKYTLVRVHVRSEILEPVDLRLRGFETATGDDLPGSPLTPRNPGGFVVAGPDVASKRDTVWGSALFVLPREGGWRSGEVSLVAESDNSGLNCAEAAGLLEGDCTAELSFEPSATPEVTLFSINWKDNGDMRKVSLELRSEMITRLTDLNPVARIRWRTWQIDWPLNSQPLVRSAFNWTERLRTWDNCSSEAGCRRIYYGAMLGNGDSEKKLGRGALPGTHASGYVPSSSRRIGRQTYAHELGHNLNRQHAVHSEFGLNDDGQKVGACGAVADAMIPDFPNLFTVKGKRRPTLGPMDQGDNAIVWGFDTTLGRPVNPKKFFDLMSYCIVLPIDFWPSLFTYRGLLDEINQRFDPVNQKLAATPQDWLIINGIVDLASGAVDLEPTSLLPNAHAPDVSPAGVWTAQLLDADNNVLDSISFDPLLAEALGGVTEDATFMLASGVVAGIARIEIRENAVLRAAVDASSSPPTVDVLVPDGGEVIDSDNFTLQWAGSDADNDELSYIVQYSADDGQSWRTIAVDLREESYSVARSTLPASSAGRLRVIASDGLLTSVAESAGTFTVSNNPPSLIILEPGDQEVFTPAQSLSLRADGYDPEDGPLGSSAFSWSSDRDGALGTGSELLLVADNLSAGIHVLTATASDSAAATSSREVTIEVLGELPADLADVELRVTAAATGPGSVPVVAEVFANGPAAPTDLQFEFTALGTDVEVEILETPAGWSCSGTAGQRVCLAPSLNLFEASEFSIAVQSEVAGDVSVDAMVSASGRDPVPANNEAGTTVLITSDILFRDGFETAAPGR